MKLVFVVCNIFYHLNTLLNMELLEKIGDVSIHHFTKCFEGYGLSFLSKEAIENKLNSKVPKREHLYFPVPYLHRIVENWLKDNYSEWTPIQECDIVSFLDTMKIEGEMKLEDGGFEYPKKLSWVYYFDVKNTYNSYSFLHPYFEALANGVCLSSLNIKKEREAAKKEEKERINEAIDKFVKFSRRTLLVIEALKNEEF